jgi:hypothetical protein
MRGVGPTQARPDPPFHTGCASRSASQAATSSVSETPASARVVARLPSLADVRAGVRDAGGGRRGWVGRSRSARPPGGRLATNDRRALAPRGRAVPPCRGARAWLWQRDGGLSPRAARLPRERGRSLADRDRLGGATVPSKRSFWLLSRRGCLHHAVPSRRSVRPRGRRQLHPLHSRRIALGVLRRGLSGDSARRLLPAQHDVRNAPLESCEGGLRSRDATPLERRVSRSVPVEPEGPLR